MNKTNRMTEHELYQKALTAYIRKAKNENIIPNQPSELYSEIDDQLVILKNGSDLLAKYDYTKERFVDIK